MAGSLWQTIKSRASAQLKVPSICIEQAYGNYSIRSLRHTYKSPFTYRIVLVLEYNIRLGKPRYLSNAKELHRRSTSYVISGGDFEILERKGS